MNPFKITGPTCISFSGGRTSAYMLWLVLQANDGIPDGSMVCFANTGKEDEATLRFVRDCEVNWGVKIWWVEFRRNNPSGWASVTFKTASRNGEPFEQMIEMKKFLPNAVMRFCSHELKNKPIAKFTGLDSEDTMVGVRADEMHRVPKMRARGLQIPLVSAGVNKFEVREFWKSQPFDLELEIINDETPDGNCDLCFLKSFDTIYQSIAKKPEKAIWWAAQETKRRATFHKDRPSFSQMLEYTKNQIDFIGHDEAVTCFCGD